MAATLHSKINRKKLNKLNIIQICEEILNPSVPMALRLSGILMGGVVIVYERKAELNEVWKTKPVKNSNVLPKGKAKARYESVTLPGPGNVDTEVEPTLPRADNSFAAARLEHMRLDDLDEQYVHIEINDYDISENHHQAQAEDITLVDNKDSVFAETFHYDRFERFDMREDEIHIDLTTPPDQEMPNIIPSPPRYDDVMQVDNTTIRSSTSQPPDPTCHDDAMPFDNTTNPQCGSPEQQDEQRQKVDNAERRKAPKRRAARNNVSRLRIDDEQIMISGTVYQSWLKDTSQIVTKRRKVNQVSSSITLTALMEVPPVAIITGYEKFPPGFYFPKPIMDLWQESTRPKSPEKENLSQDNLGQYNPDDSVERMRKDLEDLGIDAGQHSGHFTPSSPGHSGSARSARSLGSGPTLPVGESEMLPTGRSKRRQQSSLGGSHLETVEEEPFAAAFKIRRVSEEGPTPETEPLMETGPTPTQTPLQGTSSDVHVDPMTLAIKFQLKLHFETPGAPKYESLVLATRNYIKVVQEEPYGDVQISRGPKM
ncbi:Sister chromatid cohesion 1 protein 1 [Carex littledalei]|uniref:Sister chromatid cohesion 1 protein 1 n=1 Tax=Carex littledalei TaxID=544730 RepID=A0A833R5Q1_9POAL|nr:Sister chromatid cohesion 1 protein 1 [Carex littledalei]